MRTKKIIEFTGMPNSGKTTMINRLAEDLKNNHNLKVEIRKEDAQLAPDCLPKKTWDRNVYITFGQLQSLVVSHYYDADIVFLDRGLFDAFFWAEFLLSNSDATAQQTFGLEQILVCFYQSLKFTPTNLILLDVSVEESIRRRSLLGEEIVYSNKDFLTSYKEHFFKIFNDYIYKTDCSKQLIPIPSLYVDTTGMSTDQVYKKLKDYILEIS